MIQVHLFPVWDIVQDKTKESDSFKAFNSQLA